jgi:predicted nucleotide-binding protein
MLQVSVPIAYELLAQCIKQGEALVQRASLVGDFSDYESWKAARKQWIDPTAQALAHMYGGPSEAREFAEGATCPEGTKRWQEQYGADLKCVKQSLAFLTELQGELAFTNGNGSSAGELASGDASLSAGGEATTTNPYGAQSGGTEHRELAGAALEPGSVEGDVREERSPEPAAAQTPAQAAADTYGREPQREQEPPTEREAAEAQPSQAPAVEQTLPQEHAPVGAELAHPQQVGAELAQHAQPSPPAEREPRHAPAPAGTRDVYLAHGRDEKWKQAVEHLLEQSGEHEIKIVNRRAHERARLTDELREDPQGSHYAVVLLTADDVGGARLESDTEPYFSTRAHQQVVFEMGFLVAALTPGRVCVLYEDGVELPCDLDGVSHVRLDLAGTWQPKLLLHLRRAGFDYDMNRLASV